MSRLTPVILAQLEQAVQGTCHSLEQHFNDCSDCYGYGFEFDDLTSDEEQELYNYIGQYHFECDVCGWWCEVGDYSMSKSDMGNSVCSECATDEEEE